MAQSRDVGVENDILVALKQATPGVEIYSEDCTAYARIFAAKGENAPIQVGSIQPGELQSSYKIFVNNSNPRIINWNTLVGKGNLYHLVAKANFWPKAMAEQKEFQELAKAILALL